MDGSIETIKSYLGEETDYLLNHTCEKIRSESLYLPGHDFVDRTFVDSDRPTQVLRNLKSIYNHGRLARHKALRCQVVDLVWPVLAHDTEQGGLIQ